MAAIKLESLFRYSLNLGLRGATLGLRFLLTLFLGKYFAPEVLGSYGMFATTILVSFLIISFSFESYATRAIVQSPREEQFGYVLNLFAYFFSAYGIFVVVGTYFVAQVLVDKTTIVFFIIILFLETIVQVLFSLFSTLRLPTSANLILFISQASWILIVFGIWLVDPTKISGIREILITWIIGNFAAAIYGGVVLKKFYKDSTRQKINWKWVASGLSVSALFFISSIAYKIIEFGDRYFIEFKIGTAQLGIYVFYSQIANLMNAIINVTVILMLYPRLIEAYFQKDFAAYRIIKRKMYFRILVIGVVIAIGVSFFMKLALIQIGKASFYEHIEIFYVLLVSNLAMNFSFVAHYCLFAMHKDRALVVSSVVGAICAVCLNAVLVTNYGIIGAAVATCCSFLFMWLVKTILVGLVERNL